MKKDAVLNCEDYQIRQWPPLEAGMTYYGSVPTIISRRQAAGVYTIRLPNRYFWAIDGITALASYYSPFHRKHLAARVLTNFYRVEAATFTCLETQRSGAFVVYSIKFIDNHLKEYVDTDFIVNVEFKDCTFATYVINRKGELIAQGARTLPLPMRLNSDETEEEHEEEGSLGSSGYETQFDFIDSEESTS